ncbi:glycogen debranching N-terminal domain-containing protein [Paenarthrobacter sp. NPDC089322]|uniref:glycogen debranching N-terminal domain-containing protein n=1 Tax=Paenarthrobacter sp. NPDC089322 TaxID=3155065 RepID=UPI0034343BE4
MTSTAPPSAVSVLVARGAMMRGPADGGIGSRDLPGVGTEGLYVGDTRILSRWLLEIDEASLWAVGNLREPGSRTTALVPMSERNQTHSILAVRKQELAASGLTETVEIRNLGREAAAVQVVLRAGTDFADQFALRTDGRQFDLAGAAARVEIFDDQTVTMRYSHTLNELTFQAGVHLVGSPVPKVLEDDPGERFVGVVMTWSLTIPAGESHKLVISATVEDAPPRLAEPLRVETAGNGTSALGLQSRKDLDSLLMPCPALPGLTIPAAGLPWFLTLFGRDSLLTSMLARKERPGLLGDVLRALAATQGTVHHAQRLEQPGKIVHEVRVSELAHLGAVPYSRYYGTVDSTALFLMALGHVDDPKLLRELEPAARAAVGWICEQSGLETTGFVRYTPDPNGLLHQGWKDSFDAVAGADGREPVGSIALAEVQGYTWRGLHECALIAAEFWDDNGWARKLSRVADDLRKRFREAFWMERHNFPAMALDGNNDQVDALASNAGHLLWAGILDEDDACAVTTRLMADDFFTGWGIRTLAAGQHYYHPMSYHNGSVWPHDTMLAAEGMAAYGFMHEASRIADGMREAAGHFGNSLPELFGGFSKADFATPLKYHHAGSPQAWAAAAGLSADRLSSPNRDSL